MSLKIVTGGTTGAADGTLVSSGNKPAFTAIDGVVSCHIRMDDDTYSIDQYVTVPSDGDIEISFDGGSTWKTSADNPIAVTTGVGLSGVDVGDLNFPIKLRQHATTATVSGQFTTEGTTVACTALADVTSFVVTPGSTTNVLTWAAVTSRTAYRIDRATNVGFTTGVTLDLSPGLTATTFTDTGLTNGTTYYYRIKAVGTYRFKDSANYATGNGVPDPTSFNDTYAGSAGYVTGHTATTGGQSYQAVTGNEVPKINGSGLLIYDSSNPTGVAAALVSTALGDDIIIEAGLSLATGATGDQVAFVARSNDTVTGAGNYLLAYLYHDTGGVKLGLYNGTTTYFFDLVSNVLGSYSAGTVYTVRLELSGSSCVLKINGTSAWSGTVTTNITGGKIGVRLVSTSAPSIDFLRLV